MKKLISFIFTMLFSVCLNAQEHVFQAPDYDLIQKNISDKNSEFYYPNLLKRIKAHDDSLTQEEFTHLYYGYLFQKEYTPFYKFAKMKELNELTNVESGEFNHEKIINLLEEGFDKNPIDFTLLPFLSFGYEQIGKTELSEKVMNNYYGFFGAIASSGNGQKCETGFHVLFVDHEYEFLEALEFVPGGQSLINEEKHVCDRLEIKTDNGEDSEIYFEISKMWEKEGEILLGGEKK